MKTHTFAVLYSLLLALFPLLAFIQMNCLNVLLPHLQIALAVPQSHLSLLSGLYSVAVTVSLLPAGWLMDRVAFKPLLAFSMSLLILGSLIFAEAHTLTQAVLGRIVIGCSHAFAFITCFRWIALKVAPQQQGLLTGLTLTFAFFGGFLAEAPLAMLINALGWHQAMLCQSVFTGILLIVFLSLLPPLPLPAPPNQTISHRALITRCFLNSQNWLTGLFTCFMGAPLMLLGAFWGEHYLITTHAMTPLAAASTSGMLFLGAIFGSPLVGFLVDKFNHARRMMLASASLVLLLLALVHITYTSAPVVMSGLFFLMGVFSSGGVLGYVLVQHNNPPDSVSFTMSFVNMIIMAGTAGFQLLFGLLETYPATSHLAFYYIVGLVFLSFMIAGYVQPVEKQIVVAL